MRLIFVQKKGKNLNTAVINNITDIKNTVKEWRKSNYTIGLVPTMGALHNGHASLIKKAKETCDKVIVSVFVNPIQFGPSEDFDKYPRTLDKDQNLCSNLGVDIVFAPSANEMYGENNRLNNTDLTFVYPPFKFTDCLCGKTRTGHFDGVATVVLKLFNISDADYAFFGQKDAQQLFIINKMVKDLNLDIKIISCPIVRESDGLALSSRNKYLSDEERSWALSVSKALKQVKTLYSQGVTDTNILFDTAISILNSNIELEYLEFRDYNSFEPIKKLKDNSLVAIAVKVGKTRLIDNIIT